MVSYLDNIKPFYACCQIIDWLLIVRKWCKNQGLLGYKQSFGTSQFPLEIHTSSFGDWCDWVGHQQFNECCFILEELSNDQCNLVQRKNSDTNIILPSAQRNLALRRVSYVFQNFFFFVCCWRGQFVIQLSLQT